MFNSQNVTQYQGAQNPAERFQNHIFFKSYTPHVCEEIHSIFVGIILTSHDEPAYSNYNSPKSTWGIHPAFLALGRLPELLH